jgi:hypothetical protein
MNKSIRCQAGTEFCYANRHFVYAKRETGLAAGQYHDTVSVDEITCGNLGDFLNFSVKVRGGLDGFCTQGKLLRCTVDGSGKCFITTNMYKCLF